VFVGDLLAIGPWFRFRFSY